jgi:hypothetical protein
VSGTGHPFASIDKEGAMILLRAAGSHDPDVLRGRKETLIRSVRRPKLAGASLALAAVLVCLTRVGPVAGLAVAVAGWWLWRRGARNVAAVEAGYTELVKSPAA